jgi:hypothetical protein
MSTGQSISSKTKFCKNCGKTKLLNDFSYGIGMKDGKKAKCKACSSAYEKLTKEEKQKLKEANKTTGQKKYFEEFVKVINQNGGICLGTYDDYKNAYSLINVKCHDGHIWKQSLNNVRTRGCPTCKTNTGELISLGACDFLFGKKFIKVRPSWLKNNKDNNLELDIYNEELKLAVEYNGIQHYEYIPFFHRNEENFRLRLNDDKIKIDKCKEYGVKLIIVPYTVDNDNVCSFICNEATKLSLPVIRNPKDFSYAKLRETYSLKNVTNTILENMGAKIIQGTCFDSNSKLIVECKRGHKWTTRVKYIKMGRTCTNCKFSDPKKEGLAKLGPANANEEIVQVEFQEHNRAHENEKIIEEHNQDNENEEIIQDESEENSQDNENEEIIQDGYIQANENEEIIQDESMQDNEDEEIIQVEFEEQINKNIKDDIVDVEDMQNMNNLQEISIADETIEQNNNDDGTSKKNSQNDTKEESIIEQIIEQNNNVTKETIVEHNYVIKEIEDKTSVDMQLMIEKIEEYGDNEKKRKAKISGTLIEYFQTEQGKATKKQRLVKRSETMMNQKAEYRGSMVTKTCTNCKGVKAINDFGVKADTKDGLQPNCKICVKELKQKWRAKNKTVQEMFSCDECTKTYKLKDSLTRHKKEKHLIVK